MALEQNDFPKVHPAMNSLNAFLAFWILAACQRHYFSRVLRITFNSLSLSFPGTG